MSKLSLEPIDQALFGYADGHRQIASSIRLPPKDLYLLSSASDLVSGVRLGENDSYLTGLPLPESRKYALFRTWSAPEMPRPGCVWSHALLLDARAIASLDAFSVLLTLFRRPMQRSTSLYGDALELTLMRSTQSTEVRVISQVIGGYYVGKPAVLSADDERPGEIENAILAVWSQQWPRLRANFSFCTALLSERGRSRINEFDVQVASFRGVPLEELPSAHQQSWVAYAAADASENKVTPLRRFLWRYGRDLSNSRRHFRMLVELYSKWKDVDELPVEFASIVFEALPDRSDGAVLKRDILGIGSSSPRLTTAISAVDLLQLLTSEALPEIPTPLQVEQRLGELTSDQIGKVARYFDHHRDELSAWAGSILNAIVARANRPTVVAPDFPPNILADVLLVRNDLIDPETLLRLTDRALYQILQDSNSSEARERVILEMLRRDLGEMEDRILDMRPVETFSCAIDAFSKLLDQSWLRSIPHHSETILGAAWLEAIRSTADLATAFAILRYPRRLMKTAEELSRRLAELTDDALGIERTNMQAVLLRVAIDESSAASWRLISMVLPELRPAILKDELPSVAQAMLTDDLPRFYSAGHWDLNRRILLCLARLYKSSPADNVLSELSLSPSEFQLVISGEDKDGRNPLGRFWGWY